PYAWTLDFEALGLVPALALGYLLATRRFPTERRRVACFAAGALLILAAFVTPLHMLSMHYLLSAHLLQHVVLAESAPAPCVLGLLPALIPRAVYHFYSHAPRLWGLSPLTDQQIGGAAMALEQATVLFVAGTYFFLRFLGGEDRADAYREFGQSSYNPAGR